MAIASLGTLQLMVVSFGLACALGMVVALLRISRFAPLRGLARLYIGFFRGVPVLVILYWIYFALPEMGYEVLVISSYTAAVLGLGIHGGAFLAEIFRSGIESLHRGQMEAALSLGMTPAKAMSYVILPQACASWCRRSPTTRWACSRRPRCARSSRRPSSCCAPRTWRRPPSCRCSLRARRGLLLLHELPLMRAAEYLEARMGRGR